MYIGRAILQQVLLRNRFVPYLIGAWIIGAAGLTARLWPECARPFESLAGMGWRFLGSFLYTMGVLVWAALLHGLDSQLSPAAIQLVPRLRRGIILVTLVSWLVMATALALQVSVYGVPFPLLLALFLGAMALMVSRAPSTRKYPLIPFLLVWVVICGYRLPFSGDTDATRWVAWMAALLGTAVGATFIVTQLGKRPEAHAKQHRIAHLGPSSLREPKAQSAWDAVLRRPKTFEWVFERTLRKRSPEARMLHGLGTVFHWSHALVGVVFQATPACLLMYVLMWVVSLFETAENPPLHLVTNIASFNAFFFAILLADFRARELHARQKEQALLLLLPGVPTGTGVNRLLIQTQLLHHAVAIVSALWFVLAVALVFRQSLESTLMMTAPPLVASLLTTPVLVRDYARMRQPRPLQYFLLAMIAVAPLYWTVAVRRSVDPIVAILIALPLGGMIAAWRYAALADAPTSFPVGRLAPR